jgi:hypothetical protein
VAGAFKHSRKALLAKLGDSVTFHRQPFNAYDPHAIAIAQTSHVLGGGVSDGEPESVSDQLGFVPATLAVQLAPLVDSGAVRMADGRVVKEAVEGKVYMTISIALEV